MSQVKNFEVFCSATGNISIVLYHQGRILNRFSKDMDGADEELSSQIYLVGDFNIGYFAFNQFQ